MLRDVPGGTGGTPCRTASIARCARSRVHRAHEYAAYYGSWPGPRQVNPASRRSFAWLARPRPRRCAATVVGLPQARAGQRRAHLRLASHSSDRSLPSLLQEHGFNTSSALLLNVPGQGSFLDLPTSWPRTPPTPPPSSAAASAHRDELRHFHFSACPTFARALVEPNPRTCGAACWAAVRARARGWRAVPELSLPSSHRVADEILAARSCGRPARRMARRRSGPDGAAGAANRTDRPRPPPAGRRAPPAQPSSGHSHAPNLMTGLIAR